MHHAPSAAVQILTSTIDPRVAALIPAAQNRILADTFSFSTWLARQCAAAPSERVLVLKARRHGVQALLESFPTHALAAMVLDMRQPVELLRDARDALVLRYLDEQEVKNRVLSLARQMALDAEREAKAASPAGFFRRIGTAARDIAAAV